MPWIARSSAVFSGTVQRFSGANPGLLMRFGDLISNRTIKLRMSESRKESAIHSLVQHVCEAHELDEEVVLREVLERERSLSTGVGQGVAVPHALIEGLESPIVGLGCHSKGLEFDSIDGQPVHLLFLLLSPAIDIPMHLKLLSRVSRICQQSHLRTALLAAESPSDILESLRKSEANYTDL